MKRIYIAGAYSSDNVLSILDNIGIGMRTGTELMLKGYAPFVPWFDHQFQFMLRDGETLTVKDYYDYSIEWLKVSEAMLVLPNSENSKGTQKEIEIAKKLKIPIYYSIKELKNGCTKKN